MNEINLADHSDGDTVEVRIGDTVKLLPGGGSGGTTTPPIDDTDPED